MVPWSAPIVKSTSSMSVFQGRLKAFLTTFAVPPVHSVHCDSCYFWNSVTDRRTDNSMMPSRSHTVYCVRKRVWSVTSTAYFKGVVHNVKSQGTMAWYISSASPYHYTARLVTGTRRTEHITLVLQSLHWLLQTCNTGA